ncbi:uncharacterized protein PRCAT00003292001 [Priceomyces carsonii]|uniref:uncharacterized protein n=1 Tax=Priceomyces carsonii TaxID=28549 RepID=UPI002ED988DB|nr:unnamed protein product [Priceomyces carsonii]
MSHHNTPHLYSKRTPVSSQGDGFNGMNAGNGLMPKPLMDSSTSILDSLATNAKQLLNAYVYDFLVKNRLSQSARMFANEADVPYLQNSSSKSKNSPQMNNPRATHNPSNLQFQKDNNLPMASVAMDAPQGFLYEWWQVFWDVFQAKNSQESSNQAFQYYQLQILKQRQLQEMRGINTSGISVPNGQFMVQPHQQQQQQRIINQGQPQAIDPQQQQQQQNQAQSQVQGQPQSIDPQQQQQQQAQHQAQSQPQPQAHQQLQPQQQQQQQQQQPQPQQQMMPNMGPGNGFNLQQQMFLSQQVPQQPQNRIQQHAQTQMNNLRQQAQQVHQDNNGNTTSANQRLNQVPVLQQQQAIGGMSPFQPQFGNPSANNFAQSQQPQGVKMNHNNKTAPSDQIIINSNSNFNSNSNSGNSNNSSNINNANNNMNNNGKMVPNNSGTARNMNALQDYQMQLMLLEKQNKKRLDIARKTSGDQPGSLDSGMFPPHTQQIQLKQSPAAISNSPIINSKPSPSILNNKKKKEPPAKRGRKVSGAGNTLNGLNNVQANNQGLQMEYSTPLTPASETTSDPLSKRKRKNASLTESPKKQANKGSNTHSAGKKEQAIKEEPAKLGGGDSLGTSSTMTTLPDSNGDNIFQVEILGGSNSESSTFFGPNGQPNTGLDEIDFDFNQFLEGNGEPALSEGMSGFNWGGVDAIENVESMKKL